MNPTVTYYTRMPSPIGDLTLVGDGAALTGLHLPFGDGGWHVEPDWRHDEGRFTEVRHQLAAYFAGELTTFTVPLAPRGTDFQMVVWRALSEIPYGHTISYGELARRVGRPGAARAVGLANGRNPLPIIVPCHRVVAANGHLGGYGGGPERKRRLLDLEAAVLARGPMRP